MKKLVFSTLAIVLIGITAFSNTGKHKNLVGIQNSGTNSYVKKKNWSKAVWSEIEQSQKINSVLFAPFNEPMAGLSSPYGELDPEKYVTEKEAIHWNLWTILVSSFVQGEIDLYLPFNPEWETTKDNGHLRYPFNVKNYGSKENGNFQTDPEFKDNALFYGILGYEVYDAFASPLKSLMYPDEDSIAYNKNGSLVAVYPPNDFIWFKDKDIIKYKIKEEWIINGDGMVIDKTISSIAPMVYTQDGNGEITGEREIFWVDFNQLKPKLNEHFILLDRYKKEKILSLLDFFMERAFYASILSNTEPQINKVDP